MAQAHFECFFPARLPPHNSFCLFAVNFFRYVSRDVSTVLLDRLHRSSVQFFGLSQLVAHLKRSVVLAALILALVLRECPCSCHSDYPVDHPRATAADGGDVVVSWSPLRTRGDAAAAAPCRGPRPCTGRA